MRRLLDSPWLYFGLAGVLLVAAIASQFRIGPEPLPTGTVDDLQKLRDRDDLNVVFVLVDTLRADRLGAYGYERPTSPNLDALAARGIRFENVEAQSSWTKTSMASLWTGRYPQSTGILRHSDVLPEQARMPAEILSDAGFRTAGLFRNGWVSSNFGFAQGFDLYVKPQPNFDIERFKRRSPSAHPLKGSDLDLTQSAQEFLRANHDQRFFLYVHYMDVHQYVYDSNSNLFGTSFSDIYDNSIHWTDLNFGNLVHTIEGLGLADRTLYVIAADHGEAFFEHGSEGHAKTLYREVQRTPLLIVPPFALPEAVTVQTQVANIDVWPTLLDVLGLDGLLEPDGRSLLPLIVAAGHGEEESAVEELAGRRVYSQLDRSWGRPRAVPNNYVAVVDPPWRLHYKVRHPNQTELFDRSRDPLEVEDFVRSDPEVAERLVGLAEAYLKEHAPLWDVGSVELGDMELNQLRALGYDVGKK